MNSIFIICIVLLVVMNVFVIRRMIYLLNKIGDLQQRIIAQEYVIDFWKLCSEVREMLSNRNYKSSEDYQKFLGDYEF